MEAGWGGAAGTSKPVLGFDPDIFPRVLKEMKSHLADQEGFDLNSLYFLLYAFAENKDPGLAEFLEQKFSAFSDSIEGEDNLFQAAETARLFWDAFSVLRTEQFLESGQKLVEFLSGFYDDKLGALVDPKRGAAFASQNAAAVRSFLAAYPYLQNQKLKDKVKNALEFIQGKLYDPLLGLIRRFPSVSKDLEYGYLDDCAASILAFTDAYLQSGNKSYRDFADVLAKSMLQELWDREKGGFLSHVKADSSSRSSIILGRDNAVPKNYEETASQEKISQEALFHNARAFEALWRLGYIKGQNAYFKWIDLGLHRFLDEKILGAEAAFASILDMRLQGRIELEIVGRVEEESSRKMLETLASFYAPRKIISFINPDDQDYILAHGLEAESYPRLFGCVDLKRRADTPNSDRESVSRVLNAAWRC